MVAGIPQTTRALAKILAPIWVRRLADDPRMGVTHVLDEMERVRLALLSRADGFIEFSAVSNEGTVILRTYLEALDALVRRRQYEDFPSGCHAPTPTERLDRFRAYGSRWFRWPGQDVCPHCGAELRDLQRGPPFKREFVRVDTKGQETWFVCPSPVCNKTWGCLPIRAEVD